MNAAVVGAQWGDEGKGKIVDLLAPRFSIVARYAGGHNAGHTVVAGGRKLVLKLLPSGALHAGVICVIGNGTVIDPESLLTEINQLADMGIDVTDRLLVSDRAHLIFPYHRDLERLSEERRGKNKIGTTNRGIGPACEDKTARRGIRLCDFEVPDVLEDKVQQNVEARNRIITDNVMDWRMVRDQLLAHRERVQPFVTDTSVFLNNAIRAGKEILFEGAQGTMLDIDHGTYPYVTSSSAIAGGACTGLGVGPGTIDYVIGIVKAYTTRVGEGPFPSELSDAIGEQLRIRGQEFGSVTGRPRRCGWFDAVVARLAARVNGLHALALTKLDVLDGFPEIRICTGYQCADGELITEFPANLNRLIVCEPVYETLPGWKKPTAGITRFDDLPNEAQAFIGRVQKLTGVFVSIISTGPDRDATINRDSRLTRKS